MAFMALCNLCSNYFCNLIIHLDLHNLLLMLLSYQVSRIRCLGNWHIFTKHNARLWIFTNPPSHIAPWKIVPFKLKTQGKHFYRPHFANPAFVPKLLESGSVLMYFEKLCLSSDLTVVSSISQLVEHLEVVPVTWH